MGFKLTNNNIRIRYLLEKDARKQAREKNIDVALFTQDEMASKFGVRKQSCYEWMRTNGKGKLPTGIRRDAVMAWINDGALTEYMKTLAGDLVP